MVNKHDQVVCEVTNIILNDGVTIVPGYCEVTDGVLTRYDAKGDPNNVIARQKPWILHNRVEYMTPVIAKPRSEKELQGKHFISEIALEKYLLQKTKE